MNGTLVQARVHAFDILLPNRKGTEVKVQPCRFRVQWLASRAVAVL